MGLWETESGANTVLSVWEGGVAVGRCPYARNSERIVKFYKMISAPRARRPPDTARDTATRALSRTTDPHSILQPTPCHTRQLRTEDW